MLIAADSGNGISSTLDFRRYLFINVDLTVHLHRLPAGEWVCLDAVTVPEPTGVGLTDTMLLRRARARSAARRRRCSSPSARRAAPPRLTTRPAG